MALIIAAGLLTAARLPDYDRFRPDDAVIHARYTPHLEACQNAPYAGAVVAESQCMAAEDKRQDEALNAVWRQVMAHLDASRREALRSLERQWIKDRKSSATQDSADLADFPSRALMYGTSYADETIRRTLWLEKLR